MATPSYKGAGQPSADNGSWGGLGSWFGGGTPAYKSAPTTNANESTNVNTIARAIDASSVPGGVVVLVPRGAAVPCDVTDPQDDNQQ